MCPYRGESTCPPINMYLGTSEKLLSILALRSPLTTTVSVHVRTDEGPPGPQLCGLNTREFDLEGSWAKSVLANVIICRGFQVFFYKHGTMVHQKRRCAPAPTRNYALSTALSEHRGRLARTAEISVSIFQEDSRICRLRHPCKILATKTLGVRTCGSTEARGGER